MNPAFPLLILAQDAPASDTPRPPAPVQSSEAAGETATTGADGQPLGTPGDGTAPPPSPFGGIMPLLLGVLLLMFIFTITSGRKEKKRKQEMLNNLSKGAKVQTVGGIIGSWPLGRWNAIVVGLGMSPRGEVGIVVAALGLSLALVDNETYAVLLAAVIITTLVAPVMLQWAIPRAPRDERHHGGDIGASTA